MARSKAPSGYSSGSHLRQQGRGRAASTGALSNPSRGATPSRTVGGRSGAATPGVTAEASPPADVTATASQRLPDALRGASGGIAGVDDPGPGDHSSGYRGPWPHYKTNYWELGRKSVLDPVMAHRPPSEWGVPHRHHYLSTPLMPPRVFNGIKSLLPSDDVGRPQESHRTFRQPVPSDPTATIRPGQGEFGVGGTIIKPGTVEKPVRISVGEDRGQKLPPTPPIRQEGDMTKGFKGTEPHYSSTISQHGRVGFQQPEWGVPDKHHFLSMPTCYPKLVHSSSVPGKPKKQEGDMTRGFEGPRPHMWTSYWEFGHDTNFKHTRKRYDFTPVAEANYRFALARDGFPGSSA